MTIQPLTFGALLKRFRRATTLTQAALAERAGFSVSYVGMLERGERTPQPSTIELLADALELAAEDRATLLATARPRMRATSLNAPPSRHVSPRLIGRTRELGLLERHLSGDGPPLLLLAGEPGIGKSRLLQEARVRAAQHGLSVLAGSCHRRGGQEPFAPIVQALSDHIRNAPLAQLRAELEGCAWLVRLLPELAEASLAPAPPWTLPAPQERRLMFAAVARFLTNVAGPSGTLLALDDLQWAGADALDLLATLVHATTATPVRIVGAYRSTEIRPQDPLAVMLVDLARERLATQMELGPLRPEEAGELFASLLENVANVPTAEVTKHVLQRTGGVPFFLTSWAQELRFGVVEERVSQDVPWDVVQSIRLRVAMTAEEAQELLGVVAVVGRSATAGLLGDITERPEREVAAALDAACQARLLVEEPEDGYRFAHDVIQEVVETDLGTARRTMLHRRVAQALERAPGSAPIARLAYHYSRSGAREKAIFYLEGAGDHAQAVHANAEAEGYYRALIIHLDGLGRATEAARVREKLGLVLRTVARHDQALEAFTLAASTFRSAADAEGLARTTAQIAWIHARRGTPQAGVASVRSLLDSPNLRSISADGLAMLHVALAELDLATARYDALLVAAERAAEYAQAAQDRRLLAQAVLRRGTALHYLGRMGEARRSLEEARAVAEEIGDLWSLCRAVNNLGIVARDQGAFDESQRDIERAIELAERLGDPTAVEFMWFGLGMTMYLRGEWGRASEHFERAALLAGDVGTTWVSAYSLLGLGMIQLAKGNWALATRHLEETIALGERIEELQVVRYAHGALAERDLLQGDPSAARTRLEPLLDRPGMREIHATMLMPLLAWAYLDLDEGALAEEMAAQSITRATDETYQLALVDALRIQALVATRHGRYADAESAVEGALALAQAMPHPYARAKALYVRAQLHVALGDLGPAHAQLHEARAILARLGERLYAEKLEQTLTERS